MSDFAAARSNMVDCQIQTNGVTAPGILDVFESLPREKFVPRSLQDVAYRDSHIGVTEDRFLLEPTVHAKMVQALEPKGSDVVLDIGGGTGYSAAILSPLVSTVIALEDSNVYIEESSQHWREVGAANVVAVEGKLTEGHAQNAPYDLIFLGGSVANIPAALVEQLAVGGRLVAIVRAPDAFVGQITVLTKLEGGASSSRTIGEAAAPFIAGFEPMPEFTF